MEEINIKDLFDFAISKLRIIILIILVVVLLGAAYSLFISKPVYEAKTTLVLTGTAEANNVQNKNVENGITITQNDINLNSKLVATYREVIKSITVLKDVINTLNLDCTVSELQDMISVSTVQDTEMISITVSNKDAVKSAKIANELAVKFSNQIKEIYNIENISIIDKAEVPTVPSNVNIVKQIIIYTLIGIVIALAVIFAMYYFDTTVKDAAQIEKIGFTVLTSIPEKQEGGRRK